MDTVSSEITMIKSTTRKYVKVINAKDTNATKVIQENAFSSENMGAASLDLFVLTNILQTWNKKSKYA